VGRKLWCHRRGIDAPNVQRGHRWGGGRFPRPSTRARAFVGREHLHTAASAARFCFCDQVSSVGLSRGSCSRGHRTAAYGSSGGGGGTGYTTESFDLSWSQPPSGQGLIGQGLMAAARLQRSCSFSSIGRPGRDLTPARKRRNMKRRRPRLSSGFNSAVRWPWRRNNKP